MPSEWAYAIAREQRRDVETMAANLDAGRQQGRIEGLERSKVGEVTPGEIMAYLRYKQTCEGRRAILAAIHLGSFGIVCAEHLACAEMLGGIIEYLEGYPSAE